MTERIDTEAVLADCLSPNPANYKSDFQCMTIAIKRLEAIRGALAQEIADREADRNRLETLERNIIERKHIDATPDKGYPLRLLRAYRADCDMPWSAMSDEQRDNPLTRALNVMQHKRAIILDRAIAALAEEVKTIKRPTVVCLCGSTRFMEAFFDAGWNETLAGRIVLSVGVTKHIQTLDGGHSGEALGPEVAAALDELHKRKIDLADEILVLDVGGYVGESTRSEIEYARSLGKRIRWLSEENAALAAGEKPHETIE